MCQRTICMKTSSSWWSPWQAWPWPPWPPSSRRWWTWWCPCSLLPPAPMAETTSLCTRTHKEWSPEREVKCKKTKTSPTTCLLCDRCVDKTLLTFWNSVFFLQIFPILFMTTFEGAPHLDWFPLCHFRGSHLQLGLACTDLVSLDWAARQSTHSFYPLLPPTPSPTPPYPPPFPTIGRVSWRFTNTLPSSRRFSHSF